MNSFTALTAGQMLVHSSCEGEMYACMYVYACVCMYVFMYVFFFKYNLLTTAPLQSNITCLISLLGEYIN
jgi:hypothetical protein